METSPLIDEEANDTGRVDNVSSSKPSSSTSQNSNETPPIDFLPASIQDPTRSRPTFYTPSMMLETMNSTMSTVGGSVELKRKLDDGTLIDAKEGEKKAADLQAKMRQSAEEVLGLKFEEKVIWAGLRRAAGNQLFQSSKYQEAMDIYMTALVAISNDPANVSSSDSNIALPVLLNLSMCALNLGNASKAVAFCNHAISLESGVGKRSHKVYFRRGKGRLMTGDYKAAKEDLKKSLKMCEEAEEGGVGEGEKKAIQKEIQKLQKNVMVAKENKKKVKKAMIGVVEGGQVIDSKIDAGRAPAFKKRVSTFNGASAKVLVQKSDEGEGDGWVGMLLDYVCCRRRKSKES